MQEANTWVHMGLVISAFPYGENDLILKVILQEEGKATLYARRARNSKKRFGSPFDLFDSGHFGYRQSRGSIFELEHFSSLKSYRSLREDLVKLSVASTLCEASDILTLEHHANPFIFNCLERALTCIEEATDARTSLRACFGALCDLLEDSGYSAPHEFGEPTKHNLMRVMHRIEQCAERQLKTKQSLTATIELLKRAA